nr:hypothetical protein [Tanacetum cinerariifolium]
MVAILEKSEHNVDFHPIVDFVEASPLSPSFSGRIVPVFDTILVPQSEGSGTPTEPHHTPFPEALQTSPATYSSPTLPPVSTAPIPTVTISDTPHLRQYTIRARIAQSLALLPVADEHASPLRDVSQGKACLTVYSLDAKQDRANIAKTSTMPHESTARVTSLADDEGTQELEINSLKTRIKLLEDKDRGVAEHSGDDASIKGRRLDVGEEAAKRVSDDRAKMPTVLTSMDAVTVLVSGAAKVPTGSGSIPTAGPLAAEVPTGSDVVPTAGLIFAIATMVTPYTRRKGKEKMIESETPKKIQEQMDIQMARQLEEEMERDAQRMNEQIVRDAEIARIHAEEELQIMIDGLDRSNETVAKYLQEYHQFATELPLERRIELISDLVRGMTFEEIEAKFTTVWKHIKNFIPMGSKEEAKRFKRKGIRFDQESMKKLKTSEEVPEEVKTPDKVPEEKVKEMMQLVPIKEITRLGGSSASFQFFVDLLKHLDREDLNQLWALVKESLNIRPTSIEWKLYDTCGVHHVTSKDKEIFMLVEKDYPLRKGLVIVMIYYKLQVENYSQMASDLILKIHKIANRLRQEDD